MFPIIINFVPYSLPKPYLPELENLSKLANIIGTWMFLGLE
jgi:hypothetical protein